MIAWKIGQPVGQVNAASSREPVVDEKGDAGVSIGNLLSDVPARPLALISL
jgi:hypothetical protein